MNFYTAKRANIDLKTFWNAIRLSAGNSYGWETIGPFIFKGAYDPSFTIELFCKDMQLGHDMAKNFKVSINDVKLKTNF